MPAGTMIPPSIFELARLEQHGYMQPGVGRVPIGFRPDGKWSPGWADRGLLLHASGEPTNDTTLVASVQTIDGHLAELRQDAGAKWAAKVAAEKAVTDAIAKGTPVTPDSDLFKAMDAAGKDYGAVADSITSQEVVKARLLDALGQEQEGIHGEGSESRDGYVEAIRELRGELLGRGLHKKSEGQRVVESAEYRTALAEGKLLAQRYGTDVPLGRGMEREELAALITGADGGSAGAFVQPDRQGYYPLALRPFTVLDLITIGQTDSDLVEYVKMLTFTNAAAETPEAITAAVIDGTTVTAAQGGRKPESAMTFQTVQEAVSAIAHWVPATKRSLADASQLRTIIDGMLRWGLGDRLERQVVAGDGTGENLLGMLEQTGMNSIGAGAASHADKIHMGMTQNRLDGFPSTGVILNPINAETIWLSRENTGGAGTGGYLFGNPNSPGPRTLWGLPVAETPAMPSGTAIVGALRAFILWLREGTQVLASDSHVDFFTRNLVAVLAEMRAAAGLPTPQALCEVNLAAS